MSAPIDHRGLDVALRRAHSREGRKRLAPPRMLPEEFVAWMARMGLTGGQAALLLGYGRRAITAFANDRAIPGVVVLACEALERRKADGRLDLAALATVKSGLVL